MAIFDITGKQLKHGELPTKVDLSMLRKPYTPEYEAQPVEKPYRLKMPTGEEIQGRVKPDKTVWAGSKQVGSVDEAGNFIPIQPTTWEEVGEAAKKIGIWGIQGLGYLLKPFEYFHEYVATPFAQVVTAPWWSKEAPEITPGMLTWEDIEAFFPGGEYREAYHEWEAPKYLKGALELLPWFAIPPAGRVAAQLAKLGKAGQVAAKALTPVIAAEKGLGKVIELPIKVGGKVLKKVRILKEVETVQYKPVEEILREIEVLHPERMRPYGVFGKPVITTAQQAKLQIRKEYEVFGKKLDVLRNEDQLVKGAAIPYYASPVTAIGDEVKVFGLKQVSLPGTKLTHELVTAPWIKPRTLDAPGLIKDETGKVVGIALDDLLRFPSEYIFGRSINGQLARIWAEQLYRGYDAVGKIPLTREIKYGVKPGEQYIHSVVKAQSNPKTGVVIRAKEPFPAGGRGGVSGAFKPLVFAEQAGGIKAGFSYERPVASFALYAEERYNMAGWDRAMTLVKPLTETYSQRMARLGDEAQAISVAYGKEVKDLVYVQQALNRVKRGEKLPAATVDAIERISPPMARVAKLEGAELKPAINQALKEMRSILLGVRAEAKAFVPTYQKARQEAIRAAYHEGRLINIPGYLNRVVPDKTDWGMTGREIADNIMKRLTPEKVNVALRAASRMARMGVTLEAALDTSLMFIQGMLVAGYDLSRWATGKKSNAFYNLTKEMLKGMWNPRYQDEFIAKNATFIAKMAPEGLVVQKQVEYLRPSDIEALMRKGGSVGGFFGNIFKQTYGRAGAGFGSGSLAGRITIARQAEEAWLKEGHSLRELAEFANKLTGVVSSAELGVSPVRQALESAGLFAPNYTRAYLMVMRDLLRGNKTGAEVRKAMAGMLAGGAITYVGLCEMIGQEPKLNPAPKSLGGDGAEFMSFRIGGSIIGLPGFWYSAIRMMAAVSAATEQDPERLMFLNWRENDFLRFWMGRTSPLVGLGNELITQRDYLGRRIETGDDWLREFSSYFMTIASQNLITRDPSEEEGKFHRVGAEIFGLRAFPQSDWIKLQDMKDTLAQKDFGKPFDELNLEQKDKLLEAYPDYKQFSEEARERSIYESGEDFEIWAFNARKQAEVEYHGIGEEAAQSFLAGQIDYRTYLDEEQFLRRRYQGAMWMRNFITNQADPDRAKEWAEWLEENETPEDKALDQYREIMGRPVFTAGVPDWDATEKKAKAFLASLDSETRAYVLRNRDRGLKNLPPAMRAIAEIQSQGRDIVDEYYDQPEGKARLAYRRANPTVDAWLLIMGRVTSPQTPMAVTIALRLLQERGLPSTILTGVAGAVAQSAKRVPTSIKEIRYLKAG